MVINSEKDVKMVDLDITFTDEERSNLLEYAQDNIPLERIDELMVEWALVEALKALIDSEAEKTYDHGGYFDVE